MKPADSTAEVRLWGSYVDGKAIADPYYGGVVGTHLEFCNHMNSLIRSLAVQVRERLPAMCYIFQRLPRRNHEANVSDFKFISHGMQCAGILLLARQLLSMPIITFAYLLCRSCSILCFCTQSDSMYMLLCTQCISTAICSEAKNTRAKYGFHMPIQSWLTGCHEVFSPAPHGYIPLRTYDTKIRMLVRTNHTTMFDSMLVCYL